MFVMAGTLALCLALAFYALPAIRRMEIALPDHGGAAQPA
jgi:hypothetical protein